MPQVKRSFVIGNKSTSVSLEEEFLEGLKHLAASENTSIQGLVKQIAAERDQRKLGNLSNLIRLRVLIFYRDRSQHAR